MPQQAQSTPPSSGGADDGAGPRGLPDVDAGGAGADAAKQPVEGHTEDVSDRSGALDGEPRHPRFDLANHRGANADLDGKGLLLHSGGVPGSPKATANSGDVELAHALDHRAALIFEQAGDVYGSFGRAVKSARKKAGLNQAAVAAGLGVSTPRISQLENGDTWSLDTAARMAVVLGVPLPELLGGHVLDADEAAVVAAMRRGDWLQAIEMIAGRAKAGR